VFWQESVELIEIHVTCCQKVTMSDHHIIWVCDALSKPADLFHPVMSGDMLTKCTKLLIIKWHSRSNAFNNSMVFGAVELVELD
jgi:hypothetical protein